MSVRDVKLLLEKGLEDDTLRELRQLAGRSETFEQDLLAAVYEMPEEKRAGVLGVLGEKMQYLLGQ